MNSFELNILILCQRKSSDTRNKNWNQDAKISKSIVKRFVSLHFGDMKPKLNIEHLVDNIPCNHCLKLGNKSIAVKEFLTNSYQKYDIVLFYTCPLPFMLTNIVRNDPIEFLKQLKHITKSDTIFMFGNHTGLMEYEMTIHKNLQKKVNMKLFKRADLVMPIYTFNKRMKY